MHVYPIGIIHSPFTEVEHTPIQSSRSQAVGRVEVYPEFAAGLKDIEGLSHLILLYVFDRSSGYELLTKPFLDDQRRGLFATRYPFRPNPLGLSVVRLLERRDHELIIEGVDVLDGTPLIDIKPYVTEFDVRTDVRIGWYQARGVQP
ncbi:MAG: tRNA (N6-threonylcarbamoyladenosine(37)-N6)-methyltransferase TrmO [Chloroflexi bacterium]|nr:tRNA (N6-threonylcarbamoyladenosine(37)-N6)-methyltransferase TrmO [Chloroflexota bacterium]